LLLFSDGLHSCGIRVPVDGLNRAQKFTVEQVTDCIFTDEVLRQHLHSCTEHRAAVTRSITLRRVAMILDWQYTQVNIEFVNWNCCVWTECYTHNAVWYSLFIITVKTEGIKICCRHLLANQW